MANPPISHPQLIGLAGTFASGKDTLAKYLVEDFAYEHASTSDMVRKIAAQRYGSVERPVLLRTAEEERRRRGAGAFVQEALAHHQRPLIVSGLRSLGEAKEIRQAGGILFFIDADLAVRYERMCARKRDSEVNQTLEEFRLGEQKEWYAGDDDGAFNLRGIKAMSDIVLENNLELDAFIAAAYQALGLKRAQ